MLVCTVYSKPLFIRKKFPNSANPDKGRKHLGAKRTRGNQFSAHNQLGSARLNPQ